MNFQCQSTVFSDFEQKDNTQNAQHIYEPEFFLDFRSNQEEQFQQQATDNQAQYNSQLQFIDTNIRQYNIDDTLYENQDNQKLFSMVQIKKIKNLDLENQKHHFKNHSKSNLHLDIPEEQTSQNVINQSEIQQQNNIILQVQSQKALYEKSREFLENHNRKPKQQSSNNKKRFKNQNILKDIMNSFHRYMKKLKSFPCKELECIKLSDVKKKFNRYMKIHSFNNQVIKYVLTHKYYKIIFNSFYEDGSLDKWVDKSKVNNKDMLRDWVNYLVKCIKSPELLDDLSINQQELKNKIIRYY
ncbi:hypothetical protein ABPG74_008147 [Tetrahymena malaccensis]